MNPFERLDLLQKKFCKNTTGANHNQQMYLLSQMLIKIHMLVSDFVKKD